MDASKMSEQEKLDLIAQANELTKNFLEVIKADPTIGFNTVVMSSMDVLARGLVLGYKYNPTVDRKEHVKELLRVVMELVEELEVNTAELLAKTPAPESIHPTNDGSNESTQ